MFSPLHSQMQSELGMYNSLTGDINNNATADIENFLSSVLNDPEEQRLASNYNGGYSNVLGIVKESNSCSESEGEVTQNQV